EILAEVEHMRREALRVHARHEARIFLLQHPTAGGPRHDDVATLVDGANQVVDVESGAPRGARDVARVEGRHPAADLLGTDHLDATSPEHTDCRAPNVGRVVLDGRGVEESHPAVATRIGRRPLAAEPAREASLVAWQPTTSIDPQPPLQQDTEQAVA